MKTLNTQPVRICLFLNHELNAWMDIEIFQTAPRASDLYEVVRQLGHIPRYDTSWMVRTSEVLRCESGPQNVILSTLEELTGKYCTPARRAAGHPVVPALVIWPSIH
ncbi:hypothetical protein EVAR_104020_1 [Eumeta japonica]|uniref:Uncharacterized protein n=1 Tax=Eumeta variegata TaxID=151549 RepID=A0A4C1ZAD0_EUMVA|nr:hypothetical protein EVAR_104020_1 [Eumeta japonica]